MGHLTGQRGSPDGDEEQCVGHSQGSDGQGDTAREQQVHGVPLVHIGDLQRPTAGRVEIVRTHAVEAVPQEPVSALHAGRATLPTQQASWESAPRARAAT